MFSLILFRLRFQLQRLKHTTKELPNTAPDSPPPTLTPYETMLVFDAGVTPPRFPCNFRTARWFQTRFLACFRWGQSSGITTYVVDCFSPFGLLALTVLLKLRQNNEHFNLYACCFSPSSQRRSFRLIPETDSEFTSLIHQTDYFFGKDPDLETFGYLFSNAWVQCANANLLISPNRK